MKICSIRDCKEVHYGRNLCAKHYMRKKREGVFSIKKCSNLRCRNKLFCKNLCYVHWNRLRYKRRTKKCFIKNCKTNTINKYCYACSNGINKNYKYSKWKYKEKIKDLSQRFFCSPWKIRNLQKNNHLDDFIKNNSFNFSPIETVMKGDSIV